MKPSSRVKIRAFRLNVALLRGPFTGEGKRRSSPNAIAHGLYSKQILLLPNESPEAFETPGSAIVREYIHALQPRDSFELELCRELAVACCREQRIWTIEKPMQTEKMPKLSPIWEEIVPESAIFDQDEEQTRNEPKPPYSPPAASPQTQEE